MIPVRQYFVQIPAFKAKRLCSIVTLAYTGLHWLDALAHFYTVHMYPSECRNSEEVEEEILRQGLYDYCSDNL